MIGTTLAKYKILDKLGEGGMGVVWKALDTRLEREVAIKLLPEHLAADPERLARFEREAKLLASLNHRNIAGLYGLEEAETEAGSVRFLVMELVEGEDLARRIVRGALPIHEALDIAHQLARALESAHDKGVLHRDLKPANVQISNEGRVKVLDFGLAKAIESGFDAPDANSAASPTLTSAGTQAGMIMGTAAYMSPEQARGKPLDKRSDIWSFGCLLYECLTGKSPFQGETITDTLAGIITKPADLSALPAGTPPRVLELLQRCLEKDVRNRLRDVGDARLELQRLVGGRDSIVSGSISGLMPVVEEPAKRSRLPAVAVAALLGLVVGAGLWGVITRSRAISAGAANVVRFSLDFPDDMWVQGCALSPDGQAIAYSAIPRESPSGQFRSKLYIRSFDSFEPRLVEGGEDARRFAFSPDGQWLAVVVPVAAQSTRRQLLKFPVHGSAPPLTLVDWRDEWSGNLTWLPDGDILVKTDRGQSFVRIPSGGGEPGEPMPIVFEGDDFEFSNSSSNASILPDGVHLLGSSRVYDERGFDTDIMILDLESGEARTLIENGNSPRWSPTGHIVFGRGDTVLAVPFDPVERVTLGNTVAVHDGFRALATFGDTWIDLAADGTMIYWPGGLFGDKRQIVIVNQELNDYEPWTDERRHFDGGIDVSSDASQLALGVANDAGLYDIWISEMARPRLTRFVHEPGWDCSPKTWTPDAGALIYQCWTVEEVILYLRPIDGSAPARRLFSWAPGEGYATDGFLPDGSTLILSHFADGTRTLELLPIGVDAGASGPTLWLEGAMGATLSPDNRWLAYISDSSGRFEVYIRELGENGSLGREVPVTRDGGAEAFWVRDSSGMQLRYRWQTSFYAVDVTANPTLQISPPRAVATVMELLTKVDEGDWLPDGRAVVVLKGDDEEPPERISVVLDWTDELSRRLE